MPMTGKESHTKSSILNANHPQSRIGIIATGSELISGQTANSNGRHIAQRLIDHNMTPGRQIMVGDEKSEICTAIKQLSDHRAIIITGGLGPTSDDCTRAAVSQTLARPLMRHPDAREWLTAFYQKKNKTPPDDDPQMYLPQGALALKNEFGTATGAHIQHHHQDIFMLPGPPRECIPLFEQSVLTYLANHHYSHAQIRRQWMVLDYYESQLAAEIDPVMLKFPTLTLAYRLCFPYIELKLSGTQAKLVATASEQIDQKLKTRIVSHNGQTARERLIERLEQHQLSLHLEDHATQGALYQALLRPETASAFKSERSDLHLVITGLGQYWQRDQQLHTHTVSVSMQRNGAPCYTKNITAPKHCQDTLLYIIENICWACVEQSSQ